MKAKILLAGSLLMVAGAAVSKETIRIAIGHQSKCTDTYTAGIIVKELGLIQKYLPHTGKYKDVDYDFEWMDYTSGSPITNQMLADKLDFGVMGDYPLIVNGAKFQATDSLRSLYVAGTGYNLKGSGNGIDVPINSNVYSLADLKGKSISVPIGSAAWGMTLKALQDANMKDVTLKNQSPPVGAANIAQNKIDAHADFCPWSEIMQYRGTGRKIYDGSETGVPYLHGVVVRKDYAEKYPEIVVAFMKAIIDAGNWVRQDPLRAATKLQDWTGVEKEVMYLYFSKGGILTLDPTIKPKWIEALKFDHGVLAREKAIPPLNFKQWINDKYIRKAYAEMHLNYDKDLKTIVDPKIHNAKLPPAEIWHKQKGIITYAGIADMLKAAAKYKADGQFDVSYVYDNITGVKLFGKSAFYVKDSNGKYTAFLRKVEADAYAGKIGGKSMQFAQAITTAVADAGKKPAASLALNN